MFVYTGCRTTRERNARGEGIEVYKIDKNDNWNKIQTLKTIENPSYLCFDNEKEYLYSVHGDLTFLSSYKIEEDGKLTFLNSIDIKSKNPVYITIDKNNEFLVVATLQGGSLFSIKRNFDGSLGEIFDTLKFEGKNKDSNSFAHQCIFDNNKNFLFVPTQARAKGYERLNLIKYENGRFTLSDYFDGRLYSEPRHAAIHKNNRYVYMSNEKGNDVTFLEFDSEKGKLKARQTLPTLPETFTASSDVAAILVNKNSEYVLVSNRFSDIITTYKIDKETGFLKVINYTDVLGKTPRFMAFKKDTNKLFCANEESDTIVEFELDDNGFLKHTGKIINSKSPVCILFK